MGNTREIAYPDGTRETFSYDETGSLSTYTDQAGRVTRYEYDALDRVREIRYPDGATVRRTYNELGLIGSVTDERGYTSLFQYDLGGKISSVEHPDGTSTHWTFAEKVFPGALENSRLDPRVMGDSHFGIHNGSIEAPSNHLRGGGTFSAKV